MVDLSPFKARIESVRESFKHISTDPRSEFMLTLEKAGYESPPSIRIGDIDRVDSPNDKRKGKRSGWYIYNEIPDGNGESYTIGIASFGCWKSGEAHTWCSKSMSYMTDTERRQYHENRAILKAKQDADREARNAEAAKVAYEVWSNAEMLPKDAPTHPYLAKKGIAPIEGMRLAKDGRIIIPVVNKNDEITSLQFIADDGGKKFLTGGKTKGGFFIIEGRPSDIITCEGVATGASVHEATGATVYIAFNANNLFEVAGIAKYRHPNCKHTVAGDDDTNSAGNAGRTKAMQASQGLGIGVAFPEPPFNDFNDMHQEKGIDAVKRCFEVKAQAYEPKQDSKGKEEKYTVTEPQGVLADIIGYYNATSGNQQRGFAMQTALALCSVLTARAYKTGMENYSSLFLLNVAKSGTGKEHSKTVVEKILHEANMGYLIAGDGYTSAGAVFSALIDRPRHISVIDEFGRYLEAGRDMGRGNHHQREANTKLMESIGRAHSVIRPPTYSTMTLKKDAADAIKNRVVHNPAITLLTMTTPDTLFRTLDMGAIKDGFINRFIISISDAERTIRQHKAPISVPESILSWIAEVTARYEKPHISSEPAAPITLEFTDEAMNEQFTFQQECIDKANSLERFGMAELPMRSNEMAMRISLIHALSRNPFAEAIDIDDMKWSISYIRASMEKTIDKMKMSISGSEFEGNKKEILHALRQAGAEGMTWAQMQKTAPFSLHKPKDLREMLAALKDADLADEENYVNPKGGRPTTKWMALK